MAARDCGNGNAWRLSNAGTPKGDSRWEGRRRSGVRKIIDWSKTGFPRCRLGAVDVEIDHDRIMSASHAFRQLGPAKIRIDNSLQSDYSDIKSSVRFAGATGAASGRISPIQVQETACPRSGDVFAPGPRCFDGGGTDEARKPFNPFRLFNGLFVPEALARHRGLSPGAKLAYGRLARYAGQDGQCYPAVPTLAREIGVGLRQAQKYLGELERVKLIRRISRFSEHGQTSNQYQFLWLPIFDQGVNDNAPEGVNDRSLPPVNDCSYKESHSEESHFEDNSDLDCLLTNRKNRDSQSGELPPSVCTQYPRLRDAMYAYMTIPGDEKIYPSDRHVVDVMDAARGASEQEVITCLKYLHHDRGLKPATRSGPRSFAWFATVVQDYFSKRESRGEIANPTGFAEWEDRNEVTSLNRKRFDELSDAF